MNRTTKKVKLTKHIPFRRLYEISKDCGFYMGIVDAGKADKGRELEVFIQPLTNRVIMFDMPRGDI